MKFKKKLNKKNIEKKNLMRFPMPYVIQEEQIKTCTVSPWYVENLGTFELDGGFFSFFKRD